MAFLAIARASFPFVFSARGPTPSLLLLIYQLGGLSFVIFPDDLLGAMKGFPWAQKEVTQPASQFICWQG